MSTTTALPAIATPVPLPGTGAAAPAVPAVAGQPGTDGGAGEGSEFTALLAALVAGGEAGIGATVPVPTEVPAPAEDLEERTDAALVALQAALVLPPLVLVRPVVTPAAPAGAVTPAATSADAVAGDGVVPAPAAGLPEGTDPGAALPAPAPAPAADRPLALADPPAGTSAAAPAGAGGPAPTGERDASAAGQPAEAPAAAAATGTSGTAVTAGQAAAVAAPVAAAPAGPAATASGPASAPAPVSRQLADTVQQLARSGEGTHRMTLRLDPGSLGEVRVHLVVRDGGLQVHLAAGHEALQALGEGSEELLRLLQTSGPADVRVTVRDLAGGAGQQTGEQTGQQTGQQTGGAAGGEDRPDRQAPQDAPDRPAGPTAPPTTTDRSGTSRTAPHDPTGWTSSRVDLDL